MAALRSDAVRSRERILEVARARDIHELRLNDIARDACVGVGTVYRHFPTVQALVAALTTGTLERMLVISRTAATEPDARTAFEFYLRGALGLQLEDGGLQAVLLSAADETDESRATKAEIFATFASLLDRAKAEGAVRADLTREQLSHLVCGVEYAVRLGAPTDAAALLDIMLAGLRPPA